ncbi:MAG: hypothetical protein JXJ22_14450 [Bacteroidales bacterium]|nr:hypothetical protein [Bacteroidales bacterium]
MKARWQSLLLIGSACCLALTFSKCASPREFQTKRNLMLLSTSELPRNSKYSEPAKRKTNKVKNQKVKKPKRLF